MAPRDTPQPRSLPASGRRIVRDAEDAAHAGSQALRPHL